MANPLPNEKELYEKIEKEKISIPPDFWDLLEHHLGNDIYAISLIAGSHVSGEEAEPIPIEDGRKIISRCAEIRTFLKKLREVSAPKC